MQSITFVSVAVCSFAAVQFAKRILTNKTSSEVVPLDVPKSAFSEPSHEISSSILLRKINEGNLYLYFYQDGTCRPVLAIRSPKLKKRLGVYRYSFSSIDVPEDVSRDCFADVQRDFVINFVKEKLRSSKVVSEVVSEVAAPALPHEVNSVEVLPSPPASKMKTYKGLILKSFSYEEFPYGDKDKVSALSFCARFTRDEKNFVFWGSDMRRAIVACKAEPGDVCNVIDFGKSSVSDEKGNSFQKRLYEVDLVKQ